MTIAIINKAWNWKGFKAIKIIQTNDFGNVIFETETNEFWRICPEEISCEKVAINKAEYEKLKLDLDFIEDWEMSNMNNLAKEKFGEVNNYEKYCFKLPPILGGEYSLDNLGKINFSKMITLSGEIGFQIKDLKDGEKIKVDVK